MKKLTAVDLAALVIWLIPIVYLLYIYRSLPETVPMHYDAHGVVNSYGSKSKFLLAVLSFSGVGLLVYLLLRFLPAIDPKKKVKLGETTFMKIALGVMVFISGLGLVIIYATLHRGFQLQKLLFPMMGLFLAFLGNLMHSVKPNYFVGIRTPWTLEDEDTWRATHQLAAKFWVAGGIIITILTLCVPDDYLIAAFMPSILIITFVPIIYSYVYYKKHHKGA